MALTSSKEVIDNVDNLLIRDLDTAVFGVLSVHEQGTCDVLDTVLEDTSLREL